MAFRARYPPIPPPVAPYSAAVHDRQRRHLQRLHRQLLQLLQRQPLLFRQTQRLLLRFVPLLHDLLPSQLHLHLLHLRPLLSPPIWWQRSRAWSVPG